MTIRAPLTQQKIAGEPTMLSVSLLGATGSIGASTIDLLRRDPVRYRIEAVSAHRNAAALAEIARSLNARFAAIGDPAHYGELKEALSGTGIEAGAGDEALVEAAQRPADWVMAAIMGASGLKPTMAAVERGATIALANKECLVCAGSLFMRRAAATGATVLPVDSEHNAVFQALKAGRRDDVQRVILTASGGPFRTWTSEAIAKATPEQALRHPNWSMGAKITIDSATLMNKGLELIEAHHLFQLAPEELDVLVHPQSAVHAMVEFRDGSIIAQLGAADMRVPISYCLAWPDRSERPGARLDFTQHGTMTFEAPDLIRFPALALAKQVLASGGEGATVLNAANEVAVAEFLNRRLGFAGIAMLVEATLLAAERHKISREPESIEDALSIDHISRSLAADLLPEIAAKAS
jgi:1-deoxy-D-xylulose-5-phosphate reductoisomerase